ncbi:MAG: hypothetical protein OXU64_11935 [Gemmatimonadota bacterium]|nr:hypothetical protein [Gemmatimonadota bacterium]
MRSSGWLALPAALAGAACDSTPPEPRRTQFIIGGERPTTLIRPRDYVDGTPIPVVLVLHGYGGNWAGIDRYFGISRRVNRDRFAVIHPSGTLNPAGRRFWDATDYCCDFWESDPDDVGYFDDLIEEAGEYVTVGGAYLIGLSNGGFMSYRMACESMPKLRGIVNLAGSSFHDANRCAGARDDPVALPNRMRGRDHGRVVDHTGRPARAPLQFVEDRRRPDRLAVRVTRPARRSVPAPLGTRAGLAIRRPRSDSFMGTATTRFRGHSGGIVEDDRLGRPPDSDDGERMESCWENCSAGT